MIRTDTNLAGTLMENKMISEFSKQISEIESINNQLQATEDLSKKHEILNAIPEINQFLEKNSALLELYQKLESAEQFVVKALIAVGQGSVAFNKMEKLPGYQEHFANFISSLKDIENFYEPIGGIIGYHLTLLKLISSKEDTSSKESGLNYYEPEGFNLLNNAEKSAQYVRWGLEHMHKMAEIYPLGGAGDRLNLQDEKTGQCLPAAQLFFGGRTLFEGMIRDLEGREFLYYKLFGKQIATPIAIMTSHEKNNHNLILQICEGSRWFGRDKSNFFIFAQILVPMVTEDGYWAMQGPLNPILKPGGHGVIWKNGLDKGLFEWLEQHHCSTALVRQINNPIAGVDNGLLALTGIGNHQKKKFGFASCPRILNMPEGMDVLCEKERRGGYDYCITNVEYTDFENRGIEDLPKESGSPFSLFPANTNILFVDLSTIESIAKKHPIPGMLINMKSKVNCLSKEGKPISIHAGRLESTMQNIADYIVDTFPKRLKEGERGELSTFLTYNERKKTISVTKKTYKDNEPFIGTPEGCHFEIMQNYHDLLANHCHFTLPAQHDEAVYLKSGPAVLVNFHPALGMLYPVISQKLKGGKIAKGSEWIMEISEAEIVNLELAGSMIIEARSIMGKKDDEGMTVYDSAHSGKCTLINVSVKNRGVRELSENVFWKHQIDREECLKISLEGNGEFFAENVQFKGNFHFEVPDGHRTIVEQKEGEIVWHTEKIEVSTWMWHYTFDKLDNIVLTKINQIGNS